MLPSKSDMWKAMGVFGLITTCDLLNSLQSGRPLLGGGWLLVFAGGIAVASVAMVVRSLRIED